MDVGVETSLQLGLVPTRFRLEDAEESGVCADSKEIEHTLGHGSIQPMYSTEWSMELDFWPVGGSQMGVLFLLNVQMFGIEINSTLRTAMGVFL